MFASIDEIRIVGTARENAPVIVVGSPSEHVDVKNVDRSNKALEARVLFFWTVPPPLTDWPKNESATLDRNNDFIVDYPTECHSFSEGAAAIKLPNPRGLSGGGFWDQGWEKEEIWAPERCKLVAIQSRWDPKQRYLRAIQVIHWLRLVYTHNPDLRETIRNAHNSIEWETNELV